MPKVFPFLVAATVGIMLATAATVSAASPGGVGLGTADAFAVLAGQTVTNTGPSIVNGDLGVSPGTAVTGFPPGVVNGVIHPADAVAAQAQSDLTAAYNNAAGRTADVTGVADLTGLTFAPGVYNAASTMALNGTVTLDAQGDLNAVWIFQAGSTLTTASSSTVALVNAAQACNVFWQVGSSATLGTSTSFAGSILALTSITVNTSARIDGRALARNGAVTLDSNVITNSVCDVVTPPTTTTAAPATTTTTAAPSGTTTTAAASTSTPADTATTLPATIIPVDTTTTVATGGGETGGAGGVLAGGVPGSAGVTSPGPTVRTLPATGHDVAALLLLGLLAVAAGVGTLATTRSIRRRQS
jgi:hypothetical protein